MTTRFASACFAAWVLLLTILFYAFPAYHMVLWGAIGVSSASAVVAGVLIHRPRHRTPWLLLAAALLTFCAGDTTYNVLTDLLGYRNPFPSAADVFYLAMYPLLAIGLLLFVRYRSGGRDRGSLLDALVLTAGLALLSWIFLIVPYVRDADLTALEKATSVAYPIGDMICLATLARLLTSAARRTVAINVLGFGIAALLVTDVIYGLIQLNGNWQVGGPTDTGWVTFYAACGAAALHPSMRQLTQPASTPVTDLGGRRLALLAGASLIAPAVLLIEDRLRGEVHDASVIAVLSAAMFLLVLLRLAGVVGTHRQAIARERGLRRAAAALVSAADRDEVAHALRTAVAQLLPSDVEHQVVLAPASAADPPPATADATPVAGVPAAADPTHARLVRTLDLDPVIAVQLVAHGKTLCCPLALDERAAGNSLTGMLYVAAPTWALRTLQGVLEVLTSQAALALERIALTEEINRRSSDAYFRSLILNTSDVILIVDDEDRIRYASPSAATVLGTDALAGVPLAEVIHPTDRPGLTRLLTRLRSGARRHERQDLRALDAAGEVVAVEMDCRDLRDDATVAGMVLTLRDVTERRQLEYELTHQAFHDSLTGLANRVLFTDRVEHAMARSHRDGSVVGLLFIDIDDFKVVNETLGHNVGDQLLVAAAERISAALRPHDTAARLGGDEFAALIEDARNPGDVEQIAERVLAALAEPFLVNGEPVCGAASIGIGTSLEAETADELMRQADLAVYVAKGAGKGQWRRYRADLHTAMVERFELRAALDHAVNEGHFLLQYQPIVDLVTGEAVGFEALVRWHHPLRGIIPPGQFIEVAEESGLIVPIGRWVLDEALQTAAEWQRVLPPGRLQYLSVNVSARQFRTPGFLDQVRAALDASGVAPSALMLEITESLLLRDDEAVWADLAALRQTGVRIAIDDFGTGYSSLSYLRHMPIDVLKIDKSFIDDMADSTQQLALVSAIVRLAETLDLRVVAEGIEHPENRATLARMGCPYGQGYLFSRPVGAAEAFAWLASSQLAA